MLTPEQRKKLVELAKEQQPSSLGPAKERPMMGSGGSGMVRMMDMMDMMGSMGGVMGPGGHQ
ncbi:MAG: hypothetical protein HY713_00235 [candidate division NC10 bacterium]|nr:hypothetical protein [candidate division NC10 bacterium]